MKTRYFVQICIHFVKINVLKYKAKHYLKQKTSWLRENCKKTKITLGRKTTFCVGFFCSIIALKHFLILQLFVMGVDWFCETCAVTVCWKTNYFTTSLILTWFPGTLMCAIRSLMALRRSFKRRCGALCTSWSISSASSRELRACSHCHSSLDVPDGRLFQGS